MSKFVFSLFVIVLIAGSPFDAWAATPKPIQFAKGKSSATVNGSVTGNDSVDYTLRATAGQTMTVDFKASKGAAFFNVLPPGSTSEALFVGSMSGNRYEGQLPTDGVYTIRVYLMGAAEASRKPVKFTVQVSITGGGHADQSAGARSSVEQACLAAVSKTTGVSTSELSVSDVSEAESGINVMIKVPSATAPWSCLADKTGQVQGVSFTGTEGKL